MKRWRAPAMAGVAGLAAGLWVSGFGLSCVETHFFNSQEFDCPGPFRPECCNTCNGPKVSDPVCTELGWSCTPPSVSSFVCPNLRSPFCSPIVNQDAGACADAGPPSQAGYTAPGCLPQTLSCPNDGTLLCALQGIQAQNDTCQLTSECVPVPELSRNCTGWGACPPFVVSSDRMDEFLAGAQLEVDRYCGCPTCSWSIMCAGVDAGSAHCRFGHCTWVPSTVSFPCADRRTGACFGGCAADEACYTPVTCTGIGPDGGCLPVPLDAGAPGDDLCHPRCDADGGCPEGQSCFLVAFSGCGSLLLDGGTPVTPICCAADAGCVSR